MNLIVAVVWLVVIVAFTYRLITRRVKEASDEYILACDALLEMSDDELSEDILDFEINELNQLAEECGYLEGEASEEDVEMVEHLTYRAMLMSVDKNYEKDVLNEYRTHYKSERIKKKIINFILDVVFSGLEILPLVLFVLTGSPYLLFLNYLIVILITAILIQYFTTETLVEELGDDGYDIANAVDLKISIIFLAISEQKFLILPMLLLLVISYIV